MRAISTIILAALLFALSGCGFNRLVRADQEVQAVWPQVLDQYRRRIELVPRLLTVFAGGEACERDSLTRIAAANARAAVVEVGQDVIEDPAAFARFDRAQGELATALLRSRDEFRNCRSLGTDSNLLAAQAQLKDAETGIAAARSRYDLAVREYNASLKQLPYSLTSRLFGIKPRPAFDAG